MPSLQTQIANSFDAVTLKKIGKDALHLAIGTIAAYLLANIGTFTGAFNLPAADMGTFAMVVTFILKAIVRYYQGVPADPKAGAPLPPMNATL
jgi:hypothetical protein